MRPLTRGQFETLVALQQAGLGPQDRFTPQEAFPVDDWEDLHHRRRLRGLVRAGYLTAQDGRYQLVADACLAASRQSVRFWRER